MAASFSAAVSQRPGTRRRTVARRISGQSSRAKNASPPPSATARTAAFRIEGSS